MISLVTSMFEFDLSIAASMKTAYSYSTSFVFLTNFTTILEKFKKPMERLKFDFNSLNIFLASSNVVSGSKVLHWVENSKRALLKYTYQSAITSSHCFISHHSAGITTTKSHELKLLKSQHSTFRVQPNLPIRTRLIHVSPKSTCNAQSHQFRFILSPM